MEPSWWTDRVVQCDRAAFAAAVQARIPVWEAEQKRIGQIMSGIGLGDWAITAPKRRNHGYSLVVG
jgi:hypothetical protein